MERLHWKHLQIGQSFVLQTPKNELKNKVSAWKNKIIPVESKKKMKVWFGVEIYTKIVSKFTENHWKSI